jgi:hypothetical protein
MSMQFRAAYELAEGAVITTNRYNQIVRDLNALAARASAQVTRTATTMGTTLGAWAAFFPTAASVTPAVGPAAVALFTVNLNADVKDQWVDNKFRFVVNGVPEVSETGHLWIQHGPVSGTITAMLTRTSLTMVTPLVLADGANTVQVEYQTFNNAGANFKLLSARLLVWEI